MKPQKPVDARRSVTLRVELSSSSYPHFQPHSNAATQVVYHTPALASCLILPIIPREGD